MSTFYKKVLQKCFHKPGYQWLSFCKYIYVKDEKRNKWRNDQTPHEVTTFLHQKCRFSWRVVHNSCNLKKTLIILKAWWSVIAVLVILISKMFHIQRSLALLSARDCASNVNHWLTMESLLKTRRLVTMSCRLSFHISLPFP